MQSGQAVTRPQQLPDKFDRLCENIPVVFFIAAFFVYAKSPPLFR
jgi:hypothetical protein